MRQARKNLDARKIFDHADRFLFTDDHLRRQKDPMFLELVLIPAMILSAFTSELYLKCLHCIDKNEVPPGHSLKNLYLELPALRRERLLALWDLMMADQSEMLDRRDRQFGATIPRDLATALTDADRGFEQLRYLYEDDQFKFYMPDFPLVLRQAILEIQPTWGSMKHPLRPPQTQATYRSH